MTDDLLSALDRTEFIYLDEVPWTYGPTGYDLDGPVHGPVLNAHLVDLPRDFLSTLDDLHRDIDATRCWRCGDPVGFVLRTETPVGTCDWVPLALARAATLTDGATPIAVLCDPCAPFVPQTPDAWKTLDAAS